MAEQEVIPLESGAYVPYQFTWPLEDVGQDDAIVTLALVIMRRHGGLFLGLPTGYLPHEVLQQASTNSEDTLFGPHTNFSVPAFREDAAPVPDGLELDVVVVDATDLVLDGIQPLSADGVSMGFHDDIALVPSPHVLLGFAKEWLALQATQRATFYSAAEEVVPETPVAEEDLAYQLTLLEDPPSQLWGYRSGGNLNPRLRAFAPLCPQRWATIALAYLKEVDYIATRRTDLNKKAAPPVPPVPTPKKKGKNRGKAAEEVSET